MKKLYFFLFLLFVPNFIFSFGNWIEYHKEGSETIYYFKDVKKSNGIITFYNMVDNKRPNEKGIYCTIDKREASCKDFSLKYLEFKFFYGPLCIGSPDSVPSDMIKRLSWKKNSPESVDFKIIKRLCARYK